MKLSVIGVSSYDTVYDKALGFLKPFLLDNCQNQRVRDNCEHFYNKICFIQNRFKDKLAAKEGKYIVM